MRALLLLLLLPTAALSLEQPTNVSTHFEGPGPKVCNEFTSSTQGCQGVTSEQAYGAKPGPCPDKYAYVLNTVNGPCDATNKMGMAHFTKGIAPVIHSGCTYPSDQAIITRTGSKSIAKRCEVCGLLPGSNVCVEAAMKLLGLSNECSSCFATKSFCHEKKCGVQCALSGWHSDPCAECYLSKCDEPGPFGSCDGMPSDSYPTRSAVLV